MLSFSSGDEDLYAHVFPTSEDMHKIYKHKKNTILPNCYMLLLFPNIYLAPPIYILDIYLSSIIPRSSTDSPLTEQFLINSLCEFTPWLAYICAHSLDLPLKQLLLNYTSRPCNSFTASIWPSGQTTTWPWSCQLKINTKCWSNSGGQEASLEKKDESVKLWVCLSLLSIKFGLILL